MGLFVQGEWKLLGRLGVAEARQPREHHPAPGTCIQPRTCPWSHLFPFKEQTEACVHWEGPWLLGLPSAVALPVGAEGGGRRPASSWRGRVAERAQFGRWRASFQLQRSHLLNVTKILDTRVCAWHTVGVHMAASLSLSLLRGALCPTKPQFILEDRERVSLTEAVAGGVTGGRRLALSAQ